MLRRLIRGTSRKEQLEVTWIDDPYTGQGAFAGPGGSQYVGEWRA